MKQVFFFFAICFFSSCANDASTDSKNADSANNSDAVALNYPTPFSYTSNFKVGDSKHSQVVLDVWKSWDEGNLKSTSNHFADSVSMYFASGDSMKGVRDTIINGAQSFRDMYTSMKSTVHAITPLRSDKNEDWVTIWGLEVATGKDGKKVSTELQETWRFNSSGKIDLMYQYGRPAPLPNQ